MIFTYINYIRFKFDIIIHVWYNSFEYYLGQVWYDSFEYYLGYYNI